MHSPFDPAAIDAITQALAFGFPDLSGQALIDAVGMDAVNYLSAWQYAIDKETPAKMWWGLKSSHPAIASALKVDRSKAPAPYALAPFRFWRDETNRPLILAAYPTPAIMDCDWLGIETVLAWDPKTDTAWVIDDDRPQLFGQATDEAAQIFASPRAFFSEWMRKRAQLATQIQMAAHNHWTAPPTEIDPLPGALMLGEPEAIRWPTHALPEAFHVVGADPRRINRAILKSARLPRCIGEMRNAA